MRETDPLETAVREVMLERVSELDRSAAARLRAIDYKPAGGRRSWSGGPVASGLRRLPALAAITLGVALPLAVAVLILATKPNRNPGPSRLIAPAHRVGGGQRNVPRGQPRPVHSRTGLAPSVGNGTSSPGVPLAHSAYVAGMEQIAHAAMQLMAAQPSYRFPTQTRGLPPDISRLVSWTRFYGTIPRNRAYSVTLEYGTDGRLAIVTLNRHRSNNALPALQVALLRPETVDRAAEVQISYNARDSGQVGLGDNLWLSPAAADRPTRRTVVSKLLTPFSLQEVVNISLQLLRDARQGARPGYFQDPFRAAAHRAPAPTGS